MPSTDDEARAALLIRQALLEKMLNEINAELAALDNKPDPAPDPAPGPTKKS